jgi:hypothetical protein
MDLGKLHANYLVRGRKFFDGVKNSEVELKYNVSSFDFKISHHAPITLRS